MRVRVDRFTTTTSGLSVRTWLYALVGALSIVCGAFGGVIGIMILAFGDGDLWSNRSGIFLSLFTGLFPCAIGALLVWRALAARARRRRLRDLMALARMKPSFSPEDVQRTLDIGPLDAQRLVIDAASWGVIEDDADPSGAPTHLAPAPRTPPASALTSDPARWVGAVLGGTYTLERIVGAGGMGVVFAARHARTGKRYALKTLLPDGRVSEDAIRRFEREAAAASELGHPNIVAVHDYDVTDTGVHYMVLDLLEGETLDARLARVGALAWSDAKRVALEIGSALTAAHDKGLLHRDVKPDNIFLAQGASTVSGGVERAVLLDFGLVKPMDDASVSRITRTGAVVGTPLYMSPEQARGEPVDARSDVYALAAVIFEMVTGAPPFIDRTLASVYARLLTMTPPQASELSPRVPKSLDAVLARALAKSPSDRPSDVRAFVRALEAVDDPPTTERLPRTA